MITALFEYRAPESVGSLLSAFDAQSDELLLKLGQRRDG